ncbi:ABC transporter permease [Actinomycetes bacterium NPDC127524]
MNIFNIAVKEIKRDFRDVKTLIFMLATPLVLMLVLGTALSGAFSASIKVENVKVLYESPNDPEFSRAFDPFIAAAKKSGISFIKAKEKEEGKKAVRMGRYDGYMEASPDGIRLYMNGSNSINGSILEGMLASFAGKYNLAHEIAKTVPEKAETVFASDMKQDYIEETSLVPKKQQGSMDYYAMAETTMIALYGAMSASSLILSERARKTGDRLIASPVRKIEIFAGKVLGNIVINTLCITLVILFSSMVFKANWGNHLGIVFQVLLSEIIFAVSLGMGVSYLFKGNPAAKVTIMLFVQLASFFGGAYFKIEGAQGIFKFITDLSPLTWVNHALTKIIYANDLPAAIPAAALNIGGALVLVLIAVISMHRREGL